MPGYGLAEADLDSLIPKYKCPLCKRLLRDVIQTSCGHLYCLSCLDNLIVPETHISTIKCLEDGTMLTLEEVFPDNFMRREISQLPVRCTFAEEGCKWKGQVKTLEAHHKDCEAQKRNSTAQRAEVFPDNFARREISQHQAEATEISRKWKRQVKSLQAMSNRARSNDRQENALYSFISLALRMLVGLYREVELFIRSGVDEIHTIVLDILSQAQEHVGRENRELRRVIDANERRIAELEQISSLTRQLEEARATIRRLETRVESHERLTAEQDMREAEFLHQLQVSYDGTLLWKIDDFAAMRQAVISGNQPSFYSPCFYTSRHGYKMCARVYLNGDGMGRGTHISVFFTVMRGEYDALLRWPFQQKVTIMLLDQDNVEHVIDAFRPDPNNSSFQRPRREMNVASGCPLFCPLAELNRHAYVRDDVMFIKIIVDTSDL